MSLGIIRCDNWTCGASHLCKRYITLKKGRNLLIRVKRFESKRDWKSGDKPIDLCKKFLKKGKGYVNFV